MATVTDFLTLEQFHKRYDGEPGYEYWFGKAVKKPVPDWMHGALQILVGNLLFRAGYFSASAASLRINTEKFGSNGTTHVSEFRLASARPSILLYMTLFTCFTAFTQTTVPVLKHRKGPTCSAEANAAYASAVVTVDFTVDEHGRVTNAIVSDPTPERFFYRSTWQIIPKLRFKPATNHGKPISYPAGHIEFTFACMPPRRPYVIAAGGIPAPPLPAANTGYLSGTAKFMLFGGLDHKTYLGCLNCDKFSSDSLSNEFGAYGSRFSASSIFNKYGEFGSVYSNFSVCNPNGTDPPVILTKDGKFYGRLTVNTSNAERTNNSSWQKRAESVCSAS